MKRMRCGGLNACDLSLMDNVSKRGSHGGCKLCLRYECSGCGLKENIIN